MKDLTTQQQYENSLTKLSVSSTKTYDQCPKKYYYTYIEKLPRKSWAHLTLGNFCHSALEKFHKDWNADKNLDLVELMGGSFAYSREKYPSMAAEQLEEAKQMLQDYLFSIEKNGMPNALCIEDPFTLVIDQYFLRGFMDRIDIDPDGLFHIIDYKTTKNEKYLDSFQLLVYGIALRNKYPDVDKFRGSYVLLRHGSKLITEEYSMNDVLECEKKIIEFGKSIENEKIWPKIPSKLCDWCDFYEPCMGGNWLGQE